MFNQRADFIPSDSLKTDRKPGCIRPILYILLLGAGLAAGLWIGFRSSSWIEDLASDQSSEDRRLFNPATGQNSVLVIGVDRISTSARLEGVWYLAYLPQHGLVTLVPLFPEVQDRKAGQETGLDELFSLDGRGMLPRAFLNAIRERHKSDWNGYIVLDEIAMMEAVDFLGGVDVGNGHQSGPIAVGNIPPPWEDPSAALQGQTDLLEHLCPRLDPKDAPHNLDPLWALIPDHVLTDLDADQVAEDWLRMITRTAPVKCEFPAQAQD